MILYEGFLCCVAMDASENTFNMFKLPNELEQSLQKNLNAMGLSELRSLRFFCRIHM